MNKELFDLASWAIETAKKNGAAASRVAIDRERSVEISYRERRPENIKEAAKRTLSIEIFVDGRFSGQTTSDLRKKALQEFITNAVGTTRLLAKDPYRSLPDPRYYQGRSTADLQLTDATYGQYTPEERHKTARAMEEACLETGGDKVVSVTAQAQDGESESVLLTSNGLEGYHASTYYVGVANMTAQDAGDRRPNGYHYAVAIRRNDLPKPEEIGRTAAMNTLDLLGAKKIKTETLPVIIRNQDVPRVLNALLAAMYGSSIQQKRSFLADKKGQKIASDVLTLIDDPLLVGGLGSRAFDGDGLAARKRIMIDKGVLNDFFVDWYYSRKLGWEPTTGGPSNLIIPPGSRSVVEIMKELGRGIYITGFIGGNSNSTTGDSSIGILGKLFENGVPVQSVAEMNIAGNHLEFWHKLIEAANDPWPYSSWRTPSLVFKEVLVSGI
ncbi:MAG TPA: TldD/PmbA family protein [bacterium]|nr:TldD/PmbA family protein [bacterium]HQG46918.1 TldD/PmbA family protein [bacterium]HQI47942.1 TldD/PmbA family protein [bacterium]HQJ64619.1 TldD/PmbA family protein [bacterium]